MQLAYAVEEVSLPNFLLDPLAIKSLEENSSLFHAQNAMFRAIKIVLGKMRGENARVKKVRPKNRSAEISSSGTKHAWFLSANHQPSTKYVYEIRPQKWIIKNFQRGLIVKYLCSNS